jgi:hypothetical protein
MLLPDTPVEGWARRALVTTDQKGDHFHRNHRGPGDHLVRPETGRVIALRRG